MPHRSWMPLYIADYLGDTRHLDTTQHGAYLLLIMHYWMHGGIPHDDISLARIVGMRVDVWRRWHRRTILHYFDTSFRHKRIDAEIAKASAISEKRRNAVARRRDRKPTNVDHLYTHARASPQPHKNPSLLSSESRPARAREEIPEIPKITEIPEKEKRELKNGNGQAHQGGRDTPGPTRTTAPSRPPGPIRSAPVAQAGVSRKRLAARAAWEAELGRCLGAEHYGTAIGLLANNPALCDRATDAELRTPGSGVMAALTALRGAT